MATKLSAITRITYKNEVGQYVICYTTKQENGAAVKEINADIRQGELRAGNVYILADGSVSISLGASISDADKKTLISTVLEDGRQIFGEGGAE